ncbi:MAG: cytochrome c biogenesis protein ResB [Chlorobiaceae bacterium]|nr:cytochrome c biogenesis protein ResB [Chlorobiaceae bacterium]
MQSSNKPVQAGSSFEGFRMPAVFTVSAILAGFAVEWFTSGSGLAVPGWPANFLFLVFLAVVIAIVGLKFRDRPLVSWLGGIPLGLSLIIGLALLSLIGGVVPQDPAKPDSLASMLRLNGMFSSWPFAFVTLLFLFNLGLSFVWKTIPFRVANLQFILFHGGFWIALSCGLLGSSDLQRLIIPLYEGQESSVAYEMPTERPVHIPYSIYLKEFEIDEYVPQFALYDPETDRVIADKSKIVPEVKKGVKADWPGIATVTVLEFLPSAIPDSSGKPVFAPDRKGVSFARVRIIEGEKSSEEWICAGGPEIRPRFVPVGKYFLGMMDGQPKAFRSHVMVKGASGERRTEVLEVNKPIDFHGWKLYQMGYDEKAGKWSSLSLVEAVNDPWLPSVYCGFFMIMAGNLLYFWKGVKKMEEV